MASKYTTINGDRLTLNMAEIARSVVKLSKPVALTMGEHFTGTPTADDPMQTTRVNINRRLAEDFGLAVTVTNRIPHSQKALKAAAKDGADKLPTFGTDTLYVSLRGVRSDATDAQRNRLADMGVDVADLDVVEPKRVGVKARQLANA